jgi:conjugal transfer pilus assembly protein TraV
MLLTSCGPVLNPYNEDFKCRARDDAGECIDTPTAYKKARYPETETTEKTELQNGVKQEIQDIRYAVLAQLLQEEKKPLLQPPKILRVLLLPYKGEGEELFMSRYVYVKIEDSKWILTDLAEQ